MPWLTPDDIPAATRSRVLLIPDDRLILMAVNGALLDLANPDNWEQYGAVSPVDMAYAMLQMIEGYFNS